MVSRSTSSTDDVGSADDPVPASFVDPEYVVDSIYTEAASAALEIEDIASAAADVDTARLQEITYQQRAPLTDPNRADVATVVAAELAWHRFAFSLLSDDAATKVAAAALGGNGFELRIAWIDAGPELEGNPSAELAQLEAARRTASTALKNAIVTELEDRLRLEVNRLLGDASYDPSWSWEATPGLRRSVVDAEFFPKTIVTQGMRDLQSVVSTMDGGSIGLAGPRGIGKSTVLRWLAKSMDEDAPPGRRAVSVIVSAPVNYDPREFLLHLFSETCLAFLPERDLSQTALDALADDEREPGREPRARRRIDAVVSRWARSNLVFAVPLLFLAVAAYLFGGSPLAALVLGGATLWCAAVFPVGFRMRAALVVLAVGCAFGGILFADGRPWALVIGCVGCALVVGTWSPLDLREELYSSRYRRGIDRVGPSLPVLGRVGTALVAIGLALVCLAFVDVALTLLDSPDTPVLDPSALLPVQDPDLATILLAVLAPVLGGVGRSVRRGEFQRTVPYSYSDYRLRDEKDLAQLRAVAELREVRLQQSFTSSHEGSVTFSPVSLFSASAKRASEETVAPHVEGYAELVGRFRRLLRDLGENCSILVAIDELDKLEDVDDVAEFLNNLKGIFGVPGVLYITTISLEAAASFKRKGAPLREAFDSCFDEVVVLNALGYQDTRRLLNSRVVGMPRPFKALLHGLSGGLPREIVRLARRLQVTADSNQKIDLESAAATLARADLQGRLDVLDLLGLLSDPESALSRVVAVARSALEQAGPGSRLTAQDERGAVVARPASGAPEDDVGANTARVAAAFGVAWAVMARFTNSLDEPGRRDLECEDSADGIEALAQAARLVNLSPIHSWRLAESYRLRSAGT
ncbi:P-loop NTPase fold protein [Cellulomonas sp. URHD0024]|uniref:P-loop NTPase fold protein n=1 Tax=Cellulomonas sp. URHD0024 TaxID=1302620 RepID=UPI000417158E|nr:P-loop NTPase fold protein [Cellulomonas sp. URHD0024]